jgi:hypothetical protein
MDFEDTAVKVLASPQECGRLLEIDDPIEIERQPYTMMVKGVGCTRQAVGKFKKIFREKPRSPEAKALVEKTRNLNRYRFGDNFGLMPYKRILAEDKSTMELSQITLVRVQKVLGMAELQAMADENGNLRELDWFIKNGVLAEKEQPGQIFRAVRSNFSMLDLANVLGNEELAYRLSRHGLKLAEKETGKRMRNLSEYARWFIKEFLSSELTLILLEYDICNDSWQSHARNVSIMAEELDLENLNRSCSRNSDDYLDRIRDQTSWTDVLNVFLSAMNELDGNGLTQYEVSQMVENLINEILFSPSVINYQTRIKGYFNHNMAEKCAMYLREIWKDSDQRFHNWYSDLQKETATQKKKLLTA